MTLSWHTTLSQVTLVAFSIVVLSGCAGATAAVQPTPAPTPISRATASATPTPAMLTAPAQVFSGDCSAVQTDAEASIALGVGMTATPRTDPDTPRAAAVAQAGGVSCDWAQNASASAATLSAVVLPATLMTASDDPEPYCYASGDGSSTDTNVMRPACRFNLTASGFWLSGVMYTELGSTEDDVRSAISRLADGFSATAATAPAFTASPIDDAAWPGAVDCAGLATAASVTAVLPGWTASPGNSRGEMPEGYLRAATAAGFTSCLWSPPADSAGEIAGFESLMLPGGAWALDGVAGGGELTVADVERAFLVNSDTYVTLEIFDGPNWLEIGFNPTTQPVDELFAPAAGALVQALNAGIAG